MTMNKLFFDLDGTLTDPKMGITRCIQHALAKLECNVPATGDLLWCIGPPLLSSFEDLVGSERAEAAIELYRSRYAEIGMFENNPYDGISEMLAELIAKGKTLYVASSKPKVYVDEILSHFQLAEYFSAVFGAELDGTRSDKTELLAYALAETDTDPQSAIMIGDRKFDMVGAENNGMAKVAVLYGYGSEQELREAGATELALTPAALASFLLAL